MAFHPTPPSAPFLASSKVSKTLSIARDVTEKAEILEYPFLTLRSFPEGFIQRLGKEIFSILNSDNGFIAKCICRWSRTLSISETS